MALQSRTPTKRERAFESLRGYPISTCIIPYIIHFASLIHTMLPLSPDCEHSVDKPPSMDYTFNVYSVLRFLLKQRTRSRPDRCFHADDVGSSENKKKQEELS